MLTTLYNHLASCTKWLFISLFVGGLLSCQSARQQSGSAQAIQPDAILPVRGGYITYRRADTLTKVLMPEINRVAQTWILDHTGVYGFEWQPPVYTAELLYAGQLRPALIQPPLGDYYAKRTVHYLLTVSAKNGSYQLWLTNFEVAEPGDRIVRLEKRTGDPALCRSVDREATQLLASLAAYIRKTASKPL